MTSSTVYRARKRKCFSFILLTAVSALMPIATLGWLLSPLTVYGVSSRAKDVSNVSPLDGKVDIYSTTTQTNTRFTLKNNTGNTINSLTLYEFYTRPSGYMPGSGACSTPVLSFTPSSNVKDPKMACPWFTCNYLSWSPQGQGECSSVGQSSLTEQRKNNTALAVFRPLDSKTTEADSYMTLTFKRAALPPGANFSIDSCIYYDNWPHFSDQKNKLMVVSGDQLMWGTPPSGMGIQEVLKGSSAPAPAPTGWESASADS